MTIKLRDFWSRPLHAFGRGLIHLGVYIAKMGA
jgi:hypothetical protein